MTNGEMLIRLKELSGQAGQNYYERIKLVTALLDDKSWLTSSHKGDAYRAAELLEHEFFHDLCNARSIWELIGVYRKFPDAKDWEARHWNLTTLIIACKTKEPKATRRVVKMVDFEAIQKKAKDLEFQVKKSDKELRTKDDIIAELQKRVAKLEKENTHLQGRVDELEKILNKRLASA
jgi:hypothetical protein